MQHGYLQGLLGRKNLLEGKAAELMESINFVCPYSCGRRNLNYQELQQHAIWFCDDKPLETKTQLINRTYFLNEKIKEQKRFFEKKIIDIEVKYE